MNRDSETDRANDGSGDWLNPAAARRTWRRVGVPGGFMGWVGDGF